MACCAAMHCAANPSQSVTPPPLQPYPLTVHAGRPPPVQAACDWEADVPGRRSHGPRAALGIVSRGCKAARVGRGAYWTSSAERLETDSGFLSFIGVEGKRLEWLVCMVWAETRLIQGSTPRGRDGRLRRRQVPWRIRLRTRCAVAAGARCSYRLYLALALGPSSAGWPLLVWLTTTLATLQARLRESAVDHCGWCFAPWDDLYSWGSP